VSEALASWRRHPWLAPRVLIPLAAVIVAVQLPFLHWALRGAAEVVAGLPYRDNFDRASLGDAWWSSGGHWRIVKGELYSPGVGNNPLWLKARLPAEVSIEFDVRSEGTDGDIKWEAFGDGRNHSTGYVFLFGAWHNREARICKLDERALTEQELRAQLAGLARPLPRQLQGIDRTIETIREPLVRWAARRELEKLEKGTYYGEETHIVVKRTDLKVERGRRYHMRVIKQGKLVRWEIDGHVALELNDPAPLSGKGHDRFGFSSWANDTYFDNLVIAPL
jgi:hypothetical protein